MALLLAGAALGAETKVLPAQLPLADGKPGDVTKPVKVYILSGQSNMVGMLGGKVTIAATSFLQSFKKSAVIPPSGHLTLWIEEQKLPPLGQ